MFTALTLCCIKFLFSLSPSTRFLEFYFILCVQHLYESRKEEKNYFNLRMWILFVVIVVVCTATTDMISKKMWAEKRYLLLFFFFFKNSIAIIPTTNLQIKEENSPIRWCYQDKFVNIKEQARTYLTQYYYIMFLLIRY